MKRFKRVTAILLTFAAIMALTACSAPVSDMSSDPLGTPVGVVDGNSYINKRFLLGCELPEGWIVADDAERLALIGKAVEAGEGEDMAKLLERAGTWYDLYAHTEDDTQRISVTVEQGAIFNRMVYTAKDLADGSAKSLPESLASMGLTVETERDEKEIGGANREYVFVAGTNEETTIYMEVFYIKSAKYYACVTMSAKDENTIPEMEAMFFETGAF